jgi:ATP phosphoribosyltransferase
MNDKVISFALPKGRLAEDTIDLLGKLGFANPKSVDFESRSLIFNDDDNGLRFLLIRNSDVPTYVERGGADFGVVGLDVLMESDANVYEFCDLKFGQCRMSIAAPAGFHTRYRHNIRIATKYPNVTKNTFAAKGILVEIIKLYGSIEIAPLVGLSDYIVDLVETGETLSKNGLAEIEVIMRSSARLVANSSLSRIKHARIKEMVKRLAE